MENKDLLENVSNEELSQDLFELVKKDENKIHDEKFKTKATTFAKDAFKRFCKNKSSVVAAVIIGVLLLGSFLSFLSPHDIRSSHTDQALLTPKLFDTGFGFWDGTKHYSKIAWDDETSGPANFNPDHCYNVKYDTEDVEYVDQYYQYASGGYLRPSSTMALTRALNPADYPIIAYNFFDFSIASDENLVAKIDFANIEDALPEHKLCPTFKIKLVDTKGTYSRLNPQQEDDVIYEIFSGTKDDYKLQEINLSEKITSLGLSSIEHARLRFDGFAQNDIPYKFYYLIKSLTFTTNSTDEAHLQRLEDVSVTNPNHTSGLKIGAEGTIPPGFWISTLGDTSRSILSVYHAEKRTVSFNFDVYGDKLGLRRNFVVGGSIFNQYIAKGYCEFPNFDDISTFKVLNEEKCPVIEITGSSYDEAYGVYQFDCTVVYYKYLGYSKMPKYLFGTDSQGHDLVTVALSSLKTSLLVAIISSAICLVIGLIWGSISGYFGGTVDLVMERITDILGGVPWIVMMTLIILLLGNNIVTFGIALVMTGWIGTASRTRTQFYRFRDREYVLASRTLGANDVRLIFRHILPNGLGTIVTGSVLMIPGCIFSEASISYLGLGLKGVDSFGVLLSDNQIYLSSYPWLVIIPAIIISLLMISFNLFGNGLRDALNPTLKGGEQ